MYALYEHNANAIRTILVDADLALEWAAVVGAWITEHAPGGFRWHVSGDIFSDTYAQWIAAVVVGASPVRQWLYTRSFEFAHRLVDLPHLALNLSADADNYAAALAFRAQHGGRICYLSHDGFVPNDLHDDAVIFPDYSLRDRGDGSPWFDALSPRQKRMTCPVDLRGKSEQRRCGPCPRCLP